MKTPFPIGGAIAAFLIVIVAVLAFGHRPSPVTVGPGQAIAAEVSNLDFQAAADYSNSAQPRRGRGEGRRFGRRGNRQGDEAGGSVGDLGILVERVDGTILFEQYHNGANENTASHLHSATKSFWGPAIAAMIEDGLIKSYDQKVSDIITEWKSTNKKDITIRQVMQLASGLENDIADIQGTNPDAPNLYEHAIKDVNLIKTPGSRFLYGPPNFYVTGAVMARVLKQHSELHYADPLDYLDKRILSKVGVTYQKWQRDEAGNPHIPNGCYMTPRNFAKWGRFLLQKGNWNGQQIIRKDLMDELYKPSPANPDFGLFIWLNQPGGFGATERMAAPRGSPGGFMYHDGYPDMWGALGAGKNRMYMIPSQNLIIVRQTLQEQDAFQDHDFLAALFRTDR